MAYKIGFCPCCDKQIMVRDVSGRLCATTPGYRQADLEFGDGAKCRTMVCADCLKEDSLKPIFDSLTHPESQAGVGAINLRQKNTPIKITEVRV